MDRLIVICLVPVLALGNASTYAHVCYVDPGSGRGQAHFHIGSWGQDAHDCERVDAYHNRQHTHCFSRAYHHSDSNSDCTCCEFSDHDSDAFFFTEVEWSLPPTNSVDFAQNYLYSQLSNRLVVPPLCGHIFSSLSSQTGKRALYLLLVVLRL